MKSISINYFAILKEQRGLSEETLETDAATPAELYQNLKEQHGFSLAAESLKVACNDAFAAWGDALEDGDKIVFIPPVAGG